MIKEIVTYITKQLEEYLKTEIPRPEGNTEIGFIGKKAEPVNNKMIVSLFGIERETAGGIAPTRNTQLKASTYRNPPLYVNLNIVFAAVYEDKYDDALSAIFATLMFIQSHTSFKYKNETYTLEIINPNLQELNNIWSIMGGQYYPSVLCKIRRFVFDLEEIKQVNHQIEKIDVRL